ncbi:MAG: MerC domain-containing protein [Bacteroidetes bacterium]|nr:MAG: MerC domain-containing protein [Bacteroidota bacterium]
MHHHHHNPKSDILGIISSSLCLVHCLAGPVLVLLGYSFTEPGGWHLWDILFFGVSAWAVWNASKGHGTRWIKVGLWSSLVVLFGSILVAEHVAIVNIVSWLAALSLVVFHVLNLRHLRTCPV